MKLVRPLIGVIVFVAVLGGLTWLTSEVYINALHIGTAGATTIHTVTIIFWALFVFSYFSGEIVSGAHIRFIYCLCNIVLGIMFYLFLGSVALSILFAVFPAMSSAVAWGIVGISFILGILGLIQARTITTTTYTVPLKNAPASWHGKRAVFLSDTHFGLMNHKHFSNKIVSTILSLNPDLVLHGGDFYDGPTVPTAPITNSWKKLTEKIPVFYTSGNHEMYGPYELFIQSIRDAGVTVLLDEKTLHDGVEIAGITYRAKGQDKKAQEVFDVLSFDPALATILINHPPTFHKGAESAGTTLILSGHTHRGQFSPIGILTWLIYRKYNYGINSTQNMTAITSRRVGTAGSPMRLFNRPELVVIKFTV
jgi:hypothetical protein